MKSISRQCLQRLNGILWRSTAAAALRGAPAADRRYRYYNVKAPAVDFDAIRDEMISRPPKHIWDVMSPTNSHLLNIALDDFIPPSCQPAHFRRAGAVHPVGRPYNQPAGAELRDTTDELQLPEGHQLVYFPPQIPASGLLPDGTDPYQSPGSPFERRMWAGGSIKFAHGLSLDSTPALCIENIAQVAVKGPPGEEKVFVDVVRRYVDEVYRKDDAPDGSGLGYQTGAEETRTIVFMRRGEPVTKEFAAAQASQAGKRVVKAPKTPDFSISLTPTATLLFHFSALTYNAHSIHLDPHYCREEEGHRHLLVHGPLSLVLMLSVLRSQIGEGARIQQIDYRNVAPLYAEEPLRVCVTRNEKTEASDENQKWDLWVENKDGSLSIKATATTRPQVTE